MKELGQTYSFSTGQNFGDDEQSEKEDRVDEILRDSNKLQDDIKKGYYLMSSPEKQTWLGTAYLYDKAFEILSIIAHQLGNEGRDELAEKFRMETQRVADELADPNTVAHELDRSRRFNHPTEELEQLLKESSNQMRQFANWVFTGTVATKEGEEETDEIM